MPDALALYYSFMQEYANFLDSMRTDERERLEAMQSRDLARIEASITHSQANTMQLNNYEARRQAEQEKAGLGGLSFRDIVAAVPAAQQNAFRELHERFEHAVADIRFYNNKSMAVARDGMLALDPDAVLPGGKTGQAANPYQSIKENQADENASVLKAKI